MVMWGESGRVLASGLCGLSAIKVPLKGRLFSAGAEFRGASVPVNRAFAGACYRVETRLAANSPGRGYARIDERQESFGPAGDAGSGQARLRLGARDPQPDVPV